MTMESFQQTLNEATIRRQEVSEEFDRIMERAKGFSESINDDLEKSKAMKRSNLRIAVDNTLSMKADYEKLLDFSTTLSRGSIPEWKAIMIMKYAYRLPDLIDDEDRGPKWIHRVLVENNLSEVGCHHVYTWVRNHVKQQAAPTFA